VRDDDSDVLSPGDNGFKSAEGEGRPEEFFLVPKSEEAAALRDDSRKMGSDLSLVSN